MTTREDFARLLLPKVGAKPTKRNLWAFVAWAQAEGGSASFNPLNTTLPKPGATNYNAVGVKNYKSLAQGVEATAETLNYGADRSLYGYRAIRKRLRGNSWARLTLRAVERSTWGTGGLALRCLPTVKRHWDLYRNLPISS